MKGVGLGLSPSFSASFFLPVRLLCLRCARAKYNTSAINELLVFFSTLRPKISFLLPLLRKCNFLQNAW